MTAERFTSGRSLRPGLGRPARGRKPSQADPLASVRSGWSPGTSPPPWSSPVSLVPLVQVRADRDGGRGPGPRRPDRRGGRRRDRDASATGPAGAADVGWYHFTLDRPAHVRLGLGPAADGGTFQGVVSLYNEDPLDFGDPLDPSGHRLDGRRARRPRPGGLATLDLTLPAGGYDVAVSGAGNRVLQPAAGRQRLRREHRRLQPARHRRRPRPRARPTAPPCSPPTRPPAPSLDRSPLAIRLDLSAPLDPATVVAGQTVRLVYNPAGTFGDGNDVDVGLASVNYSAAANELQLFPARPLAPGSYQVDRRGRRRRRAARCWPPPRGPRSGRPPRHPQGRTTSSRSRSPGSRGPRSPPTPPATAHDLGDLTGSGLVQVAGSIGNDPFFDPTSPDPTRNPGNGVEFYHFRVSGAGPLRLRWPRSSPAGSARRSTRAWRSTGSTPRRRPSQFVAGNNNTGDPAAATDGSTPLLVRLGPVRQPDRGRLLRGRLQREQHALAPGGAAARHARALRPDPCRTAARPDSAPARTC